MVFRFIKNRINDTLKDIQRTIVTEKTTKINIFEGYTLNKR